MGEKMTTLERLEADWQKRKNSRKKVAFLFGTGVENKSGNNDKKSVGKGREERGTIRQTKVWWGVQKGKERTQEMRIDKAKKGGETDRGQRWRDRHAGVVAIRQTSSLEKKKKNTAEKKKIGQKWHGLCGWSQWTGRERNASYRFGISVELNKEKNQISTKLDQAQKCVVKTQKLVRALCSVRHAKTGPFSAVLTRRRGTG